MPTAFHAKLHSSVNIKKPVERDLALDSLKFETNNSHRKGNEAPSCKYLVEDEFKSMNHASSLLLTETVGSCTRKGRDRTRALFQLSLMKTKWSNESDILPTSQRASDPKLFSLRMTYLDESVTCFARTQSVVANMTAPFSVSSSEVPIINPEYRDTIALTLTTNAQLHAFRTLKWWRHNGFSLTVKHRTNRNGKNILTYCFSLDLNKD